MGCDPKHIGDFEDREAQAEKALAANFGAINSLIIQPKCLSCHKTGSSNNHYVNLSSYESILKSNVFPPLIVPGNPEQSSLYTSIRDGRMPKRSSKLSNRYAKVLFDWISKGAKKVPDAGGGDDDDDGGEDDDLPPDCEPDEPGCGDGGDEPPSCDPDEPGCGDDDWE